MFEERCHPPRIPLMVQSNRRYLWQINGRQGKRFLLAAEEKNCLFFDNKFLSSLFSDIFYLQILRCFCGLPDLQEGDKNNFCNPQKNILKFLNIAESKV